ncbi:Ff.00g134100.m01.CDS01 [Fusarium sp. VM40]|nr:Ff.00g134100.m01.CDS01 [Fusarium sp. VM40]
MAHSVTSKAGPPANSVTIIHPQPNVNGQVVKLSAIDQIAPRDYISSCLFFSLAPDADKIRIFQLFKRALVKTIGDIPELACCVEKHDGNSREEVALVFDCSQGARIHFKDYTSPELCNFWQLGTFEQLEREHFPLKGMPRHVVFGTSAKLVEGIRLPSLVVQCNFIPGGLILGSCLHHVVGDGICNYIFHQTMGMHLTALNIGFNIRTFPITALDRSGLIDGNQDVTLEDLPDWKLTEDPTSFLNPTDYKPTNVQTFENAIFYLSTERLATLKKYILNSSPEANVTTMEALGAFLWRHVVLARDIDSSKYPEAKLSITVDARGRIEDNLVPGNYWGNFSEPNAVARLPVASLQRPFQPLTPGRHEGSVYLEPARQIKRAIAAVSDKAVRRLVGLLNQMPKSTTLTWNVDRYPGPDMLIVCLQTHRYNDIYFGQDLGYPSAMRVTVGDTENKPDGRCIVLPPRRGAGRGLEVILQYDTSTLDRLERNSEFSRFFLRQN